MGVNKLNTTEPITNTTHPVLLKMQSLLEGYENPEKADKLLQVLEKSKHVQKTTSESIRRV